MKWVLDDFTSIVDYFSIVTGKVSIYLQMKDNKIGTVKLLNKSMRNFH